MSDPVLLPGGRDARGTLDTAAVADGDGTAPTADAVVVACPPHPQHGGDRTDGRLRAVADELTDRGVDCLRFDYGPWDRGRGERADVLSAVEWARERYDRVGLFGYSFGGAVALSAAARGADVAAVAALAPPARLGADADADESAGASAETKESDDGADPTVDVVADLSSIPASMPVRILYGTRDDVADVEPVVAAACDRDREWDVVAFETDHSFVGRAGDVADAVSAFLVPALDASD
ncbi:MAG: dienelactone hydrolase family protein [Haloquadratum sp.]